LFVSRRLKIPHPAFKALLLRFWYVLASVGGGDGAFQRPVPAHRHAPDAEQLQPSALQLCAAPELAKNKAVEALAAVVKALTTQLSRDKARLV